MKRPGTNLTWLMRSITTLTLFVTATIALGETQNGGRLVVVGGGLDADHAAVYDAFLAGTGGGRIAVIPLASTVPERTGARAAWELRRVELMRRHAPAGAEVFNTGLMETHPERAGDEAIARSIRDADAVWFTGGDQTRITDAMRPGPSGQSPTYAAVLDVLRGGGTVGGTSAGAAIMSDPMIRSGDSEEALLLGPNHDIDDPGVNVGRGLGLFPYGMVDQHFLSRGRLGRLMVAMETTGATRGFGVSDNRAMVVDLASHAITVVGSDGLTLVDLTAAERDGYARSNVRLSLLSDGDRVDGLTGEITPAAERTALEPTGLTAAVAGDRAPHFRGMWRGYTLADMFRVLADTPPRADGQPCYVTATDPAFDYRLTADEHTRVLTHPEGAPAGMTILNARFDVIPLDDMDRRAERMRQRIEARRDAADRLDRRLEALEDAGGDG